MCFKVGDKVKCIDAVQGLQYGKIYTVMGATSEYVYIKGGMNDLVGAGGWFTSRFELANDIWQDKPQWEVHRWYPFPGGTDFKYGTQIQYLMPDGTHYNYVHWPDTKIPHGWVAFKIVFYPKKKVKKTVERWGNIYPNGSVLLYTSKETANSFARNGRIACSKFTGEYEVEE